FSPTESVYGPDSPAFSTFSYDSNPNSPVAMGSHISMAFGPGVKKPMDARISAFGGNGMASPTSYRSGVPSSYDSRSSMFSIFRRSPPKENCVRDTFGGGREKRGPIGIFGRDSIFSKGSTFGWNRAVRPSPLGNCHQSIYYRDDNLPEV